MFSRVPESLRTKAGSGSSLKFPGGGPRRAQGEGAPKDRLCPGRGTPGSDTPLWPCPPPRPSTEARAPAPAPARPRPRPSPKGADAIQSQGPSQLLGRYVPFVPGALAAQSSWDSCPA